MGKSGSSREYVIRKEDVRPVPTTTMTVVYVWSCPYCNLMISHGSQKRTVWAARLHLMKKHGVIARVEG